MRPYLDLIRHILDHGTRKPNRTGVDTLSTFGYLMRLDLADGFPLLTTKKMPWKSIVVELLWFLSGSDSSSFLEQHGVEFWRPWYNPDEARTVNAAYGPAWRRFWTPDGPNDQLRWAADRLRTKPMARDICVSAWQPHIAQKPPASGSYIAPCHAFFVLNVQHTASGPTLNLHLTMRSCDAVLGVPFNIASYALLLHILSRHAALTPGILAISFVDLHIYTSKENETSDFDHVPGVLDQIQRAPRTLPVLSLHPSLQSLEAFEDLTGPSFSTEEVMGFFRLHNYNPHPRIAFQVAV